MKILKLNSCDSCPGRLTGFVHRSSGLVERSNDEGVTSLYHVTDGHLVHYCEYAHSEHPDSEISRFEIKGEGPDTIPDFCPLPDDLNQEILATIDQLESHQVKVSLTVAKLIDLRNRSKQLI